ncbi:hypothetical protein PILCRDRAFT_796906 [Piloderma croceum F 1598]|uniref:Protein kinase domain-containing protein n=1 Tax=Piloderma croceum (strain F 1598) TaxID=765440 RepID=A0A0C3EWE4_PILCF|nr:hypothetical protein PILCRDRAFT_796906 [Piloderma croceum F 1598]
MSTRPTDLNIVKISNKPFGQGYGCAVWKAKLQESGIVASLREAAILNKLDHPNVIEFIGTSFGHSNPPLPCIVLAFCDNDNISNYLKRHTNPNRTQLVTQITAGLRYLHKIRVIHGDIKPVNILIDDAHQARISDFGSARMEDDRSKSVTGTPRWMAPELHEPYVDDPSTSQASDVWAFALTVLEIFTGLQPFHRIDRELTLILFLMGGGRPERDRYASLDETIWLSLEKCWEVDPAKRPSIHDPIVNI